MLVRYNVIPTVFPMSSNFMQCNFSMVSILYYWLHPITLWLFLEMILSTCNCSHCEQIDKKVLDSKTKLLVYFFMMMMMILGLVPKDQGPTYDHQYLWNYTLFSAHTFCIVVYCIIVTLLVMASHSLPLSYRHASIMSA